MREEAADEYVGTSTVKASLFSFAARVLTMLLCCSASRVLRGILMGFRVGSVCLMVDVCSMRKGSVIRTASSSTLRVRFAEDQMALAW